MAVKRLVIHLIWFSVVLTLVILRPASSVFGQSVAAKVPLVKSPLIKTNEHFSTQTTTYSDGTMLERSIISGPPVAPPGYELDRAPVSLVEHSETMGTNKLTVPAFRWVFGCSAVSGAMIAGYYDRSGFPYIYTGPTNDGVVPLDDSLWPGWTDGAGKWYPNNPLIASHYGLDGMTTPGTIDDYWVSYGSMLDDPYAAGPWGQHAWGDAIGDYMKTSQSAYGNNDGSTSFYSFQSGAPLTCSTMENYNIHNEDGTYGRKLFYEARGYTVTDCYAQKTDNVFSEGFSFAQYKAEIDAGRPVLLNLVGHSIVGVGYDDVSNTVYIHDAWDNEYHTMVWGGSYSGMALRGVSIVNLQASTTGTTEVSVSPNPHDFGNVSILNRPIQTFTVSNIGADDLLIGTITIGGEQASAFILNENNCSGKTLAPSEVCTLVVIFTPSGDGHHSAVLDVAARYSVNALIQVALSATVVYGATPSAIEGALGSIITYSGAASGFGTKKGKVFMGGFEQKVNSWSETSVTITVSKLSLTAEEVYDVIIQPKQNGIPVVELPRAFTLKKPQIDESTSHVIGEQWYSVIIKGMWFGTKKGKVYLGGQRCKVKSWDMIPTTGISTIVLKVAPGDAMGTYDLEVENKAGRSLPSPLNLTVGPAPTTH